MKIVLNPLNTFIFIGNFTNSLSNIYDNVYCYVFFFLLIRILTLNMKIYLYLWRWTILLQKSLISILYYLHRLHPKENSSPLGGWSMLRGQEFFPLHYFTPLPLPFLSTPAPIYKYVYFMCKNNFKNLNLFYYYGKVHRNEYHQSKTRQQWNSNTDI